MGRINSFGPVDKLFIPEDVFVFEGDLGGKFMEF
jgi:hypothetical protein